MRPSLHLLRALWLTCLPALVQAQPFPEHARLYSDTEPLTSDGGAFRAVGSAVDNTGTDFYVGFMPNFDESGGATTELHLTSEVTTDVTVHYPANAPTFTATVAVGPGAVTVVDMGAGPAFAWTPGAVGNNAVWVFADNEFVAYAINRRAITTDAALALPVEALGMEYIVQTYTPTHHANSFAVVAAWDSTTVVVTPAADMEGGYVAGVPFTLTLDRGEGFLGQSVVRLSPDGDLTGTLIEADRAVQVSGGDQCTLVPRYIQSCDHLFEIAQPVQVWGRSAIAAPLPERPSGSVYRILASEDGTTVQQNGTTVATLDRGAFFDATDPADTAYVVGAQVFSADKPILVTQFITGNSSPGADSPSGDPSMGTVVPSEQYLQRYTFSTVGGEQFERDYVSIIAQNADVSGGTILLDGAPVPAADFTPIAGTGYSYAVVAIADGTHTTSSSGVHGLTVAGFDDFHSYLYPGGARFASPTDTFASPEGGQGVSLEQNYPNPFATATRIAFRLAEAGPVSLTVYDVLGREVATLVEGVLPAGDHVVEWDAAGRAMPGGVYPYRLTAGGRTATSRMTLAR